MIAHSTKLSGWFVSVIFLDSFYHKQRDLFIFFPRVVTELVKKAKIVDRVIIFHKIVMLAELLLELNFSRFLFMLMNGCTCMRIF